MATFTDGLDGTSGALLSARTDWSRLFGAGDLPIAAGGSGIQIPNGATAAFTFHAPTSQPSGNDQYVEAILGVASGYPLCVRVDATGGVMGKAYIARRDGAARFRVYYRNGTGTLTLIGNSTDFLSADADVNPFRLEAIGDQLTVYFMGSVLIGPITNTGATSGKVGIFTRGGTLAVGVSVDNWSSGDVGAAAQVVSLPLIESSAALFAPALSLLPAEQSISLPLLTNTQAFGAITLSLLAGPQGITVPRIESVSVLFSPTISPGVAVISLPHLASASVVFSPTLTQAQVLSVGLLLSGSILFPPALVPGLVTVAAPTIPSGAILFPPTLRDANQPSFVPPSRAQIAKVRPRQHIAQVRVRRPILAIRARQQIVPVRAL